MLTAGDIIDVNFFGEGEYSNSGLFKILRNEGESNSSPFISNGWKSRHFYIGFLGVCSIERDFSRKSVG